MESQKLSGHLYIRRIARSSLRQHSILVTVSVILETWGEFEKLLTASLEFFSYTQLSVRALYAAYEALTLNQARKKILGSHGGALNSALLVSVSHTRYCLGPITARSAVRRTRTCINLRTSRKFHKIITHLKTPTTFQRVYRPSDRMAETHAVRVGALLINRNRTDVRNKIAQDTIPLLQDQTPLVQFVVDLLNFFLQLV